MFVPMKLQEFMHSHFSTKDSVFCVFSNSVDTSTTLTKLDKPLPPDNNHDLVDQQLTTIGCYNRRQNSLQTLYFSCVNPPHFCFFVLRKLPALNFSQSSNFGYVVVQHALLKNEFVQFEVWQLSIQIFQAPLCDISPVHNLIRRSRYLIFQNQNMSISIM